MYRTRLQNWLAIVFCLAGSIASAQITPRPADRFLLQSAPDSCIFFMHSFGFTDAEPGTKNKAELLLQEPEIKELIAEIDRLIMQAIETNGGGNSAQGQMIYGWVKRLAPQPHTIYLSKLELSENGPPEDLDAGVILKAGPHMNELQPMAEDILKTAPPDVVTKTQVKGVECFQIKNSDAPDVFIAFHRDTFGSAVMSSHSSSLTSTAPALLCSGGI